MTPRLFHVSEQAAIPRFDPRPPPSADAGVDGDCVWAVDEAHLCNYLLPRDCPRICYRAGDATTSEDVARFLALSGADRVIAFESAWLDRVRNCRLQLYEMPRESFEEALPGAGYWISRTSVVPAACTTLKNPLAALVAAGVEVRLLQDFWPLADAVAASSLEFSIIRSRNARPRA